MLATVSGKAIKIYQPLLDASSSVRALLSFIMLPAYRAYPLQVLRDTDKAATVPVAVMPRGERPAAHFATLTNN
jgi:hypothetical protein